MSARRLRALPLACALATGLATLVTGCAVGPNYHAPAAPKTQAYTPDALPSATEATDVKGGEPQRFAFGSDLPGQWWTLFGSHELNQLIERALKQYPDMTAQQAALRAARENTRAEEGVFAPQLQGTANQQRAKISGASTPVRGSTFQRGGNPSFAPRNASPRPPASPCRT